MPKPQDLVKLWEAEDSGRSEVAVILQQVRELSGMFTSFCITYISRDANEAAHLCAKRASGATRASGKCDSPARFARTTPPHGLATCGFFFIFFFSFLFVFFIVCCFIFSSFNIKHFQM